MLTDEDQGFDVLPSGPHKTQCTCECDLPQATLYLLSQQLQFFSPGLDVGQGVTDLCRLLSHASGSFPDGVQGAVSQLLELEVQGCQVGAALKLRSLEAGGRARNKSGSDLDES